MHFQTTEPAAALLNLSGLRHVPAAAFSYPPAVNATDILLVDFDVRRVRHGSLYIIELDSGHSTWTGCRRMDMRLDGAVWIDETGAGNWKDVGQFADTNWRVLGEVREVYKPANSR